MSASGEPWNARDKLLKEAIIRGFGATRVRRLVMGGASVNHCSPETGTPFAVMAVDHDRRVRRRVSRSGSTVYACGDHRPMSPRWTLCADGGFQRLSGHRWGDDRRAVMLPRSGRVGTVSTPEVVVPYWQRVLVPSTADAHCVCLLA